MKNLMLLTFFTLLLISCSKTEKTLEIETVFERKDVSDLQGHTYNFMKRDYTTKIIRIGYDHPVLSSLRTNENFKKISKDYDLELKNISRYSYFHTPIEIIFIPVKSNISIKYLVAYVLNDKYAFSIGEETTNSAGYKRISYSAVGNPSLIYYEFQLSPKNLIGKFQANHQVPLEELMVKQTNSVGLNAHTEEILSELPPPSPGGCCSKPFSACMQCFVDSCSDDWRCWIICGIGPGPVICAASWTISCTTGSGCVYPI